MSNFGSVTNLLVGSSVICEDFIFNASAQTIWVREHIKRFLMVVNVTDGIVIYNPTTQSTKGTAQGDFLTLDYDTTNMDDLDELLVFCEVEADQSRIAEDLLADIVSRLDLLNERVEEAFETGI